MAVRRLTEAGRERVTSERLKRCWAYTDLSSRVGCGVDLIRCMERGELVPLEVIEKAFAVLGIKQEGQS